MPLRGPAHVPSMSRLFVEHLTVIDCAYLDAARGLVGESWIVDVELEGELDAQSMVLDFGDVKKRLKQAIDETVDHALLLPLRAPQLDLRESDAGLALRFTAADGVYEHVSPHAAVCGIDAAEIRADSVTAHLQPLLQALLPPNVHDLRLNLRAEEIGGAYYHYVHGLKKHLGLCQRIAHGHRSRIEIRVDGVRDAALESRVAEQWRDAYLGSRDDLIAQDGEQLQFAYTATEGRFTLSLPAARVDLIDTDSTVEQLAELLAARLAPLRPGHRVEVRAYEGVRKGAVAVRDSRGD